MTASHKNYVICIPSYQRASICNDKTLQMLHQAGISPLQVHVYVASKKEHTIYSSTLDSRLYNTLHIGKKGLVQQREFIMSQFPKGEHIVFLDDDIEHVDLTMTNIATSLHEFFEKAFSIMMQHKGNIWGVYPVHNPFYRKPRPEVYTGLSYIVGAMYGIKNDPQNVDLKLHLTRKDGQKEDVERTIKYYTRDGLVVRFDRVGFITKYYGKTGGLGTFEERIEPMREAVVRLQKVYPDIGNMYVKKTGMYEFRFHRMKENKKYGV